VKLLKPIPYDEAAMLVSTTAVETVPTWASGTSYSVDDEALQDDAIWVNLIAGSGKDPSIWNTDNQKDAADQHWRYKQPDNRSAMFVGGTTTSTEAATPLTVVFEPGSYANAVLVKGLFGATVSLVVEDTATSTVVYDSGAVSLDETLITNWYEYFFEDTVIKDYIVFEGIPPYSTSRMTLTISAGSGNVSCAVCSFGNLYDIGEAKYGASVGIMDFSKKVTDDFGNTRIESGKFADTMEATLTMDRGMFSKVKRLLSDLRATPCGWILSESDSAVFYGWATDFSLSIEYPTYIECRLEVEGLV